MNTVGIDLHRRRSVLAVIDKEGEVHPPVRIDNDPAAFLDLLGELEGETQVAVEATYGWEWLAELLEDAGYDMHLAHPLGTKAIAAARVKTDAVDARTLAQLLRAEMLPEAYIAPRELRDLRELLRHRIALTQLRTALKNRVHATLARQGIANDHADIFGKAGREFLAALELREPNRRRIDSILSLIDDFDREIGEATREIEALAREDERVPVLCQIRGVGPYTAMLIIAEIGDITRFPDARHLCSWAGLTPRVKNSDRTVRLGTSPARALRRCAGHWARRRRRPPRAAVPCAMPMSGSPSAAAARSPRWRSPARSSHSASTACATERSVALRPAPGPAPSFRWSHRSDGLRATCAPQRGGE